jgi:putative heme transporter
MALSSIIVPLFLGLLFACALGPVASRLRASRLPSGLGAAISMLLLVAVIGSVVWLTVATVVDHWGEIETLVVNGRATLEDAAVDAGIDARTSASVAEDASGVVNGIVEPLLRGVVQLVPTVAAIATSLLLSILVGFFFLKDGPEMWRWILVHLGDRGGVVAGIGQRAWTTLSAYVIGQTLIATIDATGIALGALVLGVPEPAAIFMLTFIGAYIPFIGAFLSGLVGVMLALGDSGMATGIAMLAVVIAVSVTTGARSPASSACSSPCRSRRRPWSHCPSCGPPASSAPPSRWAPSRSRHDAVAMMGSWTS